MMYVLRTASHANLCPIPYQLTSPSQRYCLFSQLRIFQIGTHAQHMKNHVPLHRRPPPHHRSQRGRRLRTIFMSALYPILDVVPAHPVVSFVFELSSFDGCTYSLCSLNNPPAFVARRRRVRRWHPDIYHVTTRVSMVPRGRRSGCLLYRLVGVFGQNFDDSVQGLAFVVDLVL
jgi:hypothetical protein